jgi:hypothetical protein
LEDWEWAKDENIKDKWIPIPTTFSIHSPPWILAKDAIVSELIDRDTQWWNKGLVEALFLPAEFKAILYPT